MARKSQESKDTETIAAVQSLITTSQNKTLDVRAKWLENFEMFCHGTRALEKRDWQADFSVNEFGTAIRRSAGNIRSNFLRRPNWFLMKSLNPEVDKYKPALEKAMRFHLERAGFRRVANTALLCSAINMSCTRVGWRLEKVKNPRLVIKETRKTIDSFNKAVAGDVDNPQVSSSALDLLTTDPARLTEIMEAGFEDFQNIALKQESKVVKEKIPNFIQRGVLDLTPINVENLYWDSEVNYMDQCTWQAVEDYVPLWKLKEMEKLGIYSNVSKISMNSAAPDLARKIIFDQVYKGHNPAFVGPGKGLVKVTEYFGHLIVNDEIKEHFWHLVYANDSVILKSQMNPFWGDGYQLPFVTGSVHEVPFRPTGQGIGDNAVKLQKALDSNYHLITDQMRLGLVGLNVINKGKMTDTSQLMDGIGPGEFLTVTDDPDKVFKHYNLTSNVENQAFPINEILRQGIQKVTGMSDAMIGAPAARSRTSATEVNQQVSGGELNLFNIAEDLEINILLPMLDKTFARVLQYGLQDLNDPSFKSIFTQNELAELTALDEESRYNTLANYFQFEINGFTNDSTRMEEIKRLTDLLTIYNKPGPLASVIRGEKVVRELVNRFEFRDPEEYVNSDNELSRIDAENRLLMLNQQVEVMPNDNHKQHMEMQQNLATMTQAQLNHLQQHQMYLAQIEQTRQASEQASQGRSPTDQELEADNGMGLPDLSNLQ